MASKEVPSYKRVAVAIDGSPPSVKAASHAMHLAKIEGAELVLLHVIEDVKQGGAIGLRARYGDTNLV
jgi:nucleotide-binding universal stress UspA family protein